MGAYYDEIEIEDMTWYNIKKFFITRAPHGGYRFEISQAQSRDCVDITTCPSCSLIIREYARFMPTAVGASLVIERVLDLDLLHRLIQLPLLLRQFLIHLCVSRKCSMMLQRVLWLIDYRRVSSVHRAQRRDHEKLGLHARPLITQDSEKRGKRGALRGEGGFTCLTSTVLPLSS